MFGLGVVEATIIAALVPLILIGIAWLVRKALRWVSDVQKTQTRLRRSVWGNEKDPRQTGLATDVKSQQEQIDAIYEIIEEEIDDED